MAGLVLETENIAYAEMCNGHLNNYKTLKMIKAEGSHQQVG